MKRISEIETTIKEIENNTSLLEEKNFLQRIETTDYLSFQIIGELEKLQHENPQTEKLTQLKHRTEKLIAALEKTDVTLFQKLRKKIKQEKNTGKQFRKLINEYFDFNLYNTEHREQTGYDNLDIFINKLFPQQAMPEQTKVLEPDMVYYQKTPARIVFDFIEQIEFKKDDVFFDLGSGLGQVTILVNLLTGIKTKGVEIEPSFCNYAKHCAAEFNLADVSFINADARTADYSTGTIFFLFTPFRNKILDNVLAILHQQSQYRKIKLITYGPCTTQVASQSWLQSVTPQDGDIYKPAVFVSNTL